MKSTRNMEQFAALCGVRPCQVKGCTGLAFDAPYCQHCTEELAALKRMAALADERREGKRRRRAAGRSFADVCAAVKRRLWVLNLAFIAGVLLYLGLTWGAAFVEWLQLGGVQ